MGSSIKSLLAFLVLAAIIGGAYLGINKLNILDVTTKLTEFEEDVTELEREILARVSQLNAVTIDESVFARPDYRTLKDLLVTLPKPNVSRPDPFAKTY